MRHLIQRPLPDELIASIWIRTALICCLKVKALWRVLGLRRVPFSIFGIAYFKEIARSTGTDCRSLLLNHSLLNYAASLLTEDEAEKRLQSALQDGKSPAPVIALLRHTSRWIQSPRWCDDCVRSDLQTFGCSYWHRSHNLPGVLVCATHHLPLCASADRVPGEMVLLPSQIQSSRRLIVRCTQFSEALCQASIARLTQPSQERLRRPRSWLIGRLEESGIRVNEEASTASVEKLLLERMGSVAGGVFGTDFAPLVKNIAWKLSCTSSVHELSPIKALVAQAALELQSKPLAGPTAKKPSRDASKRPAVSSLDIERGVVAKAFVDDRIARGVTTSVQDVYSALGLRGSSDGKRHPRVRAEVGRLKQSGVWCVRGVARKGRSR